ncbi:efflux RND transporter permease subunit [Acidomonas methanolica]|uniref:Multidrug resistance efflux pump acriflavin resistance protein n=1 Tax=Acidomonas methanolica NBRC 104435 TaxID=1231351 RepID=A0A023D169_ACIMT|nr:efflux RND transporter permease subunit [Acidomonas methanolica]MBU2654959.1 efflux RND transporter permease subunit [Acidomonas methanolica]TCS26310.1 multidrug efflux pump [Acidomonas methanolica]GAJ27804.1 multidrug resistance efflux pump acriflavin resistance protein [Acidomonas methanolica NBRC 104435]GEK99159.1 transport system membrane protein [Acidomonas methanolica NBRC 104435]
MNLCRFFILRPVMTTLLALSLLAAGAVCYPHMPVADMPNVGASTISVSVREPGATPQQMATNIVSVLERHLTSIAGVKLMESESDSGEGFIRIDFVASRNIDGALRDVQAALRAARTDLPNGMLQSDPEAFKEDPTASPVYIVSLTSRVLPIAKVFDIAETRVKPLLSEVSGVGQVEVFGASHPAVRVEINPHALFKWGIGFEDVRQALASANANTPKGFIDAGGQRLTLAVNDQADRAEQYRDLIIGYRQNAPVRLADVATVYDGVQNPYAGGYYNTHRAITLLVHAQPKANTVAIVDGLRKHMDFLRAALPPGVELHVMMDLSNSIRASLADTQVTLLISIILVIGVIFAFLRRARSTVIPAVTVPIALVGAIALMKMCGFSLDILSLMALTIAVGFVVDDAIVVVENIARHMEQGMSRREAALKGSGEIGFTILSITASLAAVLMPLMFLPGEVGAIFFEFSMTIVGTIAISLFLSLTLTPMMCANWLEIDDGHEKRGRVSAAVAHVIDGALARVHRVYDRTLSWGLRNHVLIALTLPLSLVVLVTAIVLMPKAGVPAEDISLLLGSLGVDEVSSFKVISTRLRQVDAAMMSDPDIVGIESWNNSDSDAEVFAVLRDKWLRPPDKVVAERIKKMVADLPGVRFSLFSAGDPNGGGGQRRTGTYRYVLHGQDEQELYAYIPRLVTALRKDRSVITDVTTNFEGHGAAVHVRFDRDLAARYLVTPQLVANALYDAYGQTIVSRIHTEISTHPVVMVVAPPYRQSPESLRSLWISTAAGTPSGAARSNQIRVVTKNSASLTGIAALSAASLRNAIANQITGNGSNGAAVASSVETMVPLLNVSTLEMRPTPTEIDHRDGYISAAISFDVAPGKTYDDAAKFINATLARTGAPLGVTGRLSGLAGDTKDLLINELLAFVAAIATMYIVLGILYESLIHPVTILSTLPSAGIGGILALWVCGEQFSMIAMIAMILLTGMVKKNAILVIDFALHAEKDLGLAPRDAIHLASLTRFRPILMTTLAAAFGAIPLVVSHGYGSELRRPLGIAIIGGMAVSQLLTLYTTPVIYLYMDAVGRFGLRLWRRFVPETRGPRPMPPVIAH